MTSQDVMQHLGLKIGSKFTSKKFNKGVFTVYWTEPSKKVVAVNPCYNGDFNMSDFIDDEIEILYHNLTDKEINILVGRQEEGFQVIRRASTATASKGLSDLIVSAEFGAALIVNDRICLDFYPDLFAFIQPGEEYSIEELLGEEI